MSRLHLPHAQLAFLSACATARPTQDLADEAVHIVTAFQLAGSSHVVGTLWPIDDSAAVSVADDMYRRLTMADTGINVGHTAYALHAAIKRLRASHPATPSRWAAHIHAGA